MAEEMKSDTFFVSYRDTLLNIDSLVHLIDSNRYDRIIIGFHNLSLRPANNYGISTRAMQLWDSLQRFKTASFVFGNVYATKNFCSAENLVAMHQDDVEFQHAAVDFLQGKIGSTAKMPGD